MAKFADTPEWKRRRSWDPSKQQLVDSRPATARQKKLIRKLSAEVGSSYPGEALTVTTARFEIQRLISRKRSGSFGRAATARRK
jgi:hypothetical protein